MKVKCWQVDKHQSSLRRDLQKHQIQLKKCQVSTNTKNQALRKEVTKNKDIIDLVNKENNDINPFPKSWCPDLHLDLEDKRILESGEWLIDKHVSAAQKLLKKQIFLMSLGCNLHC